MPVLSVVIPRLKTNQLKWSFSGAFEVQPKARSFFSYQIYNSSADGLLNALNSDCYVTSETLFTLYF